MCYNNPYNLSEYNMKNEKYINRLVDTFKKNEDEGLLQDVKSIRQEINNDDRLYKIFNNVVFKIDSNCFFSVMNGESKQVKRVNALLRSRPTSNSERKDCLLCFLARNSEFELFKELLDNIDNIDEIGDGEYLLYNAFLGGSIEIVQYLKDLGVTYRTGIDSNGNEVIIKKEYIEYAIFSGNLDLFKYMLCDLEIDDLNIVLENGDHMHGYPDTDMLLTAAAWGAKEIYDYLLENGSDTNILNEAVKYISDPDCISNMINCGISFDHNDLERHLRYNNEEAVDALIQNGITERSIYLRICTTEICTFLASAACMYLASTQDLNVLQLSSLGFATSTILHAFIRFDDYKSPILKAGAASEYEKLLKALSLPFLAIGSSVVFSYMVNDPLHAAISGAAILAMAETFIIKDQIFNSKMVIDLD